MSFKLTHKLPDKCAVAVSGGVDSMAALHFLCQVEGRVEHVVHVNHSTGKFADQAEERVRSICEKRSLTLATYRIREESSPGESRESYWRDQRYRFFEEDYAFHGIPIVLAHNLDDCFENYIKSTMIDGHMGTIPYRHGPCIRPFRRWKRKEIERYAKESQIVWTDDPSNKDAKFQRNWIRMFVAPRIRNLNPGVYSVVEKAIREQDSRDEHK